MNTKERIEQLERERDWAEGKAQGIRDVLEMERAEREPPSAIPNCPRCNGPRIEPFCGNCDYQPLNVSREVAIDIARMHGLIPASAPAEVARVTPDGLLLAALNLHSETCAACGGPDDGCEIGQRIEDVMLRVNPDAYDTAARVTPAVEVRGTIHATTRSGWTSIRLPGDDGIVGLPIDVPSATVGDAVIIDVRKG